MCILTTIITSAVPDADDLDNSDHCYVILPGTVKIALLSPAEHVSYRKSWEHPIATLLPDACAMEYAVLPPNAASLAKLCSSIIARNNVMTAKATGCQSIDIFTLQQPPNLDLQIFIEEYTVDAQVDQPTLVFISALMLRLMSVNHHHHCDNDGFPMPCPGTAALGDSLGAVVLSKFNVHRLFAAAAVVAAKFINDRVYPMSFYAWTLRLTIGDMRRLERAIVDLLNFDLVVHMAEFNAASRLLMLQE